ncbi:MAG: hypothetical protein Q9198_000683 [Flavoplaca austrocitrina]
MRLLHRLALAAAVFYSLESPVQSRVLDHHPSNSRGLGYLTANCSEVEPTFNHVTICELPSISKRIESVLKRGFPLRGFGSKPKPKTGSSSSGFGKGPFSGGSSRNTPKGLGSDSEPLAFGASKPGDQGFNPTGPSKDPAKLKAKGKDVDKLPYAKQEDYNAGDLQKKFDDNYKLEDNSNKKDEFLDDEDDDDIGDAIKDLGIDKMADAPFRETEVSSKGANNIAIARAKFFPTKGFMIGEERFADRDVNPPDKKLRPSDLTFFQWKNAASDQAKAAAAAKTPAGPKSPDEARQTADTLAAAEATAVKSLRAFVGRTVMSRSTVETMQTAQRRTGQALFDNAQFERGGDTDVKREGFDLMMGTDFISSLNFMLRDHAPVNPLPPHQTTHRCPLHASLFLFSLRKTAFLLPSSERCIGSRGCF